MAQWDLMWFYTTTSFMVVVASSPSVLCAPADVEYKPSITLFKDVMKSMTVVDWKCLKCNIVFGLHELPVLSEYGGEMLLETLKLRVSY